MTPFVGRNSTEKRAHWHTAALILSGTVVTPRIIGAVIYPEERWSDNNARHKTAFGVPVQKYGLRLYIKARIWIAWPCYVQSHFLLPCKMASKIFYAAEFNRATSIIYDNDPTIVRFDGDFPPDHIAAILGRLRRGPIKAHLYERRDEGQPRWEEEPLCEVDARSSKVTPVLILLRYTNGKLVSRMEKMQRKTALTARSTVQMCEIRLP